LLDRLDKAFAWKTLVRPILALPEYRGGEKGGRPAWPALTMLKCLLLAKWFGLSDPQLEDCLQDRLSFRRFVGLSLTDAAPDETTFVRFRARLRERGLDRTLFDETLKYLDTQGLLVKDGTLSPHRRQPASSAWDWHAASRGGGTSACPTGKARTPCTGDCSIVPIRERKPTSCTFKSAWSC